MTIPKLGHHMEICFSVKDIKESVSFYESLGFEIYTGGIEKGWCTIKRGDTYLALFSNNFIDEEFGVPILLNFRGGNIDKIVKLFEEREIEMENDKILGEGTGSFIFHDPNGIKFFVDTTKEEERVEVD